ncbi:hypothetical protein EYF80_013571 [Liparis tanakae]|uniref:Uncharacterized protein n=1 Tax=Liparis tanakae TaxID=230148 RepID=A0A4Z2IGL3_9TELE|nr:hypothetical protein EYF80_013571 [Liparis tanakae]
MSDLVTAQVYKAAPIKGEEQCRLLKPCCADVIRSSTAIISEGTASFCGCARPQWCPQYTGRLCQALL